MSISVNNEIHWVEFEKKFNLPVDICLHPSSDQNIYEKLKKEYIDKGLVKFEHHPFPLDLAALNAEIIIRCQNNIERKFELLTEIYKKQTTWAIGSDINKINDLISTAYNVNSI